MVALDTGAVVVGVVVVVVPVFSLSRVIGTNYAIRRDAPACLEGFDCCQSFRSEFAISDQCPTIVCQHLLQLFDCRSYRTVFQSRPGIDGGIGYGCSRGSCVSMVYQLGNRHKLIARDFKVVMIVGKAYLVLTAPSPVCIRTIAPFVALSKTLLMIEAVETPAPVDCINRPIDCFGINRHPQPLARQWNCMPRKVAGNMELWSYR